LNIHFQLFIFPQFALFDVFSHRRWHFQPELFLPPIHFNGDALSTSDLTGGTFPWQRAAWGLSARFAQSERNAETQTMAKFLQASHGSMNSILYVRKGGVK